MIRGGDGRERDAGHEEVGLPFQAGGVVRGFIGGGGEDVEGVLGAVGGGALGEGVGGVGF